MGAQVNRAIGSGRRGLSSEYIQWKLKKATFLCDARKCSNGQTDDETHAESWKVVAVVDVINLGRMSKENVRNRNEDVEPWLRVYNYATQCKESPPELIWQAVKINSHHNDQQGNYIFRILIDSDPVVPCKGFAENRMCRTMGHSAAVSHLTLLCRLCCSNSSEPFLKEIIHHNFQTTTRFFWGGALTEPPFRRPEYALAIRAWHLSPEWERYFISFCEFYFSMSCIRTSTYLFLSTVPLTCMPGAKFHGMSDLHTLIMLQVSTTWSWIVRHSG